MMRSVWKKAARAAPTFAARTSKQRRETMDRRQLKWVALLALGTAACSEHGPEETSASVLSPIIGGTAAAMCEWPSVVMIPGPGCSGTLVHPRVVMIAKHCLRRTPNSVGFGENRTNFATTVPISKCYRHPQTDFGFCVLAADVTGVPIIPVMAPCEQTELKVGAPIVEVGFGREAGQNTRSIGTKKWIDGTLVSGGPTRTVVDVTTGTQDGEYYGDSGGPVFLKMPDGTWRLIGNDWTSPPWNMSGTPRISTYTSVPYHVAWAEMQSGIDNTPCHDANGGWKPGADCVGSPINPGVGAGTWATMCAGQPLQLTPTCDGSDGGAAVNIDASQPPDTGSDARDAPAVSDDAAGASDPRSRATTAAGGTTDGSSGESGSGGSAGANSGSANDGGANSDAFSNPSVPGGCSFEVVSRRRSTSTAQLSALAFAAALGLRTRRKRTSSSPPVRHLIPDYSPRTCATPIASSPPPTL